jgi:hypothetical protein
MSGPRQKKGLKQIALGILVLLLGCPWSIRAEVRNTQQLCFQRWPDSYSMREFCEKNEYESYQRLNGRRLMIDGGIWRHCVERWAETWIMIEFCVKNEESARDRLIWSR